LKTEILDGTFGEKPEKPMKNGEKIGILLKWNHTYTSFLQMNPVWAFIYTRKTKVLKRFF
jgi:hypothetical protein